MNKISKTFHSLIPGSSSGPTIISSYFGNHSVRTRDWRFIRYADGAEELYDHGKDSVESTNCAGSSEHEEIKGKLAAWLPKSEAQEIGGSNAKKEKKK